MFLITPQPCQCSARATGSIAELSIYLIIRAGRLPRGCTSTGPVRKRAALSSSLRLRLPCGLLSPSPVGPDYLIGVKNQLFIPNAIVAFQWRKGRNEQVNIQTMRTFICTSKAMNGGRGQDVSKKKTYSRCLFYHALIQFTT